MFIFIFTEILTFFLWIWKRNCWKIRMGMLLIRYWHKWWKAQNFEGMFHKCITNTMEWGVNKYNRLRNDSTQQKMSQNQYELIISTLVDKNWLNNESTSCAVPLLHPRTAPIFGPHQWMILDLSGNELQQIFLNHEEQ